MSDTIIYGGGGKAACTVKYPDGSTDVIEWRLGKINVPAVHRVRATLVRHPVQHYVHADYGPESMAARMTRVAQLGWKTESYNHPHPPEIVGHFNLLSQAAAAAGREIKERHGPGHTRAEIGYPTLIGLGHTWEGADRFTIHLNPPAYEFYHFLFLVGRKHQPVSFDVELADLGTIPKLLAWLRPFETAKRKLYLENGFTWDPRRGPIDPGAAKGDL